MTKPEFAPYQGLPQFVDSIKQYIGEMVFVVCVRHVYYLGILSEIGQRHILITSALKVNRDGAISENQICFNIRIPTDTETIELVVGGRVPSAVEFLKAIAFVESIKTSAGNSEEVKHGKRTV